MKSVSKKDDAVSPVIGMILLVAITGVLVAIVAAVVMGMVGGIGESKSVGATASTANGFVIGTVTGGQDVDKLTSVNVTVANATSNEFYWSNKSGVGSALVGIPISVGKDGVGQTTGELKSLTTGNYQFTITGHFSDGTAQVLSTGTIYVVGKTA